MKSWTLDGDITLIVRSKSTDEVLVTRTFTGRWNLWRATMWAKWWMGGPRVWKAQ